MKCLRNFLLLPIFCNASLKDLGQHGHVFPIIEEDLCQHLSKEAGKNASELKGSLDQIKETLSNPKPVPVLKQAQTDRSYTYDPTFLLTEDIRDAEEKVILKAGTRVNPLDRLLLKSGMLFIDGEDSLQLSWAKQKEFEKWKWVFVRGNPIRTEEKLSRPVYFDQGGVLVRMLGIQSVPARIYQEGNLLRIEELSMKRLKSCNGCNFLGKG